MQTGILDKTRITANILMLVLVCLNIFFSIQYTQSVIRERDRMAQVASETEARLQVSRFMKLFVDKVLGSNGTISFEDRVKLEADIRALGDVQVVKLWEAFVASKNSTDAQTNAIKLMSVLTSKML